ncbi:hypothetical protein B0H19DRAFT_1155180 [Mycena capillaripes]|nr:hypothetical protein B0H19DRAFT_1155180 [Mycena capillaripes]
MLRLRPTPCWLASYVVLPLPFAPFASLPSSPSRLSSSFSFLPLSCHIPDADTLRRTTKIRRGQEHEGERGDERECG